MNILEKIIAQKKIEISQRRKLFPFSFLEKQEYFKRNCFSLKSNLLKNTSGIIAEFKRKSPSKQNINLNANLQEVVIGYENAGAAGVSVLTDEQFFGGKNDDLFKAREVVNMPLLRKDFIIDEYQIVEAKSIGADIILLIAAVLKPSEIKQFAALAKSLEMEILLEVHNEEELKMSLNDDIDFAGVNNRNLKTFEVSIENSLQLAKIIPQKFLKISESGLEKTEDIIRLKAAGYNGFLMGETFMKTENPAKTCADFIATLKKFPTISGLFFRKAAINDLPAIEQLAHKIWKEVYPEIISNEQMNYMLEKMYSQESLKKQITDGKHEFTLVFINDKLSGYLDTSSDDGKNYFMHKLYVLPSEHGNGVAKKLFEYVYSPLSNIKTIRLQVNRKNLRAINFYKKQGFEIEYENDFDIGNRFYMCDFVMVKKYD